MVCYFPVKMYRSKSGDGFVSSVSQGYVDDFCFRPCGMCLGCRLEKSRQWAIRCVHEASMYEDNCFITLTYDDANLPLCGSLNPKHFQDFMKRLRKKFGEGIRYYHCGEYGEENGRPHYHACIFGLDFKDKYPFLRGPHGIVLYRSPSLEKLWKFGHSSVGSMTFESAAYVARYVMKKSIGNDAEHAYKRFSPDGYVYEVLPEYSTMSRMPGLGKPWFDKFHKDVYPSDSVIIKGISMRPPRYYDSLLEVSNPELFEKVRVKRFRKGFDKSKDFEENSSDRLRVKMQVKLRALERLIRKI